MNDQSPAPERQPEPSRSPIEPESSVFTRIAVAAMAVGALGWPLLLLLASHQSSPVDKTATALLNVSFQLFGGEILLAVAALLIFKSWRIMVVLLGVGLVAATLFMLLA